MSETTTYTVAVCSDRQLEWSKSFPGLALSPNPNNPVEFRVLFTTSSAQEIIDRAREILDALTEEKPHAIVERIGVSPGIMVGTVRKFNIEALRAHLNTQSAQT